MKSARPRLSYLPIEVRSYLPSGWGIAGDAPGTFDAKRGVWEIEVRDPADTTWKLEVDSAEASRAGRLDALAASMDRLSRKALGRRSVWTG